MRKGPRESAASFGRRMGWQPGISLIGFPIEADPRYPAVWMEIVGYREDQVHVLFGLAAEAGKVPMVSHLAFYDYLPANTYWGA